jgi:hypothetical protein
LESFDQKDAVIEPHVVTDMQQYIAGADDPVKAIKTVVIKLAQSYQGGLHFGCENIIKNQSCLLHRLPSNV